MGVFLDKAFLREIDLVSSTSTKKSLALLYLYSYSQEHNEYKAEYYIEGTPALSDWITEKEVKENYVDLNVVVSDFNMNCFKNKLTKTQVNYIYKKYKEYLKKG